MQISTGMLVLAGVAAAALLAAPASAAPGTAGPALESTGAKGLTRSYTTKPPYSATHFPVEWNGVWKYTGKNRFDPNAKELPDPNNSGSIAPVEDPPYNAEAMAKWHERKAQNARGIVKDDPTAFCTLPGMPRQMTGIYSIEFLMTPGQVTIIEEWMSMTRRIYTDGRTHPSDPDYTYAGHSIGHWEGDTLVVDTVAVNWKDTIFDASGTFHSDAMSIKERIRLKSKDLLEDRITVTDPKVFTRPWVVIKTYKRAPKDYEVGEYSCAENNRYTIGADGAVNAVLLPQPDQNSK